MLTETERRWFARFTNFTVTESKKASGDVEFARLAKQCGWKKGSATYATRHGAFLNAKSPRMTDKELAFFARFSHFRVNENNSAEKEFKRLAQKSGWKAGTKSLEKRRHAFDAACEPEDLAAYLGRVKLDKNKSEASDTNSSVDSEDSDHGVSVSARSASSQPSVPTLSDSLADSNESYTSNNELSSLQQLVKDLNVTPEKTYEIMLAYGHVSAADSKGRIALHTLSNKQCKMVLGKVHVHIRDYLDCKAAGTPVGPIFTSVVKLRNYILNRGTFPKVKAKDKEDPMVKHLLIEVL